MGSEPVSASDDRCPDLSDRFGFALEHGQRPLFAPGNRACGRLYSFDVIASVGEAVVAYKQAIAELVF